MKKIKIQSSSALLILLVLISPIVSYAQDSTQLSIDDAVAIALSKNEKIKVSQYEVERQKTLKSTSMNLGKTNFDFQYGQMNSTENDFSFKINQGFEFPSVYKRQSDLAKANIVNSQLQLTVSENDLKKEVKSAWLQLAYLYERQELLAYQDSIYKRFNHATKLRYETQASSYLEQANAEVQLMEIKLHINQNEANINIYKNKLQTLLNLEQPVDIAVKEDLEKRVIEIKQDTFQISDNPMLNYFQYQADIVDKEKAVLKSKNLPDFRVGYFNQSMIGYQEVGSSDYFGASDRLSVVEFGVDIPIWFKANSAKVHASELQKVKAETNANYYESQLLGEFKRVIQEYKKLKSGVDYYEFEAIPQADLILENAQKSFESGAINYLEYVHSISAVLIIRYNYLEMLNDYNQSVVAVEYLIGR